MTFVLGMLAGAAMAIVVAVLILAFASNWRMGW